jgi:hypothetical protein
MKISLRELNTPLSLGPVLDQETFEFLMGWSEFWIGHCTPKVLLADQHKKEKEMANRNGCVFTLPPEF